MEDIIFDSQQIFEKTIRSHEIYKTGDESVPRSILDRNGEVVLSLCKRCGRGEAELETPCAATHRAPKT